MFHKTKPTVKPHVSKIANDAILLCFYDCNMASLPHHDWFLRQWMATQRTSQAELERRTGWDKRKASHLVSGKQPYKRDTLNQAAAALNIAPFELLMHPEDAFALRRLRETALTIAAEPRTPFKGPDESTALRWEAG